MATTYSLDSCVRGYHVYKSIWTAPHGEILTCQDEFGNVEDPYAVAVMTSGTTVGHVPRASYICCLSFLSEKIGYHSLSSYWK